MESIIKMRNQKAGQTLVAALQKRNFDAYYCDSKEEALKQALELIPASDVVAWGGTSSAKEIGLLDAVKERNTVIDRDSAKSPEERMDLMRRALLSDTFIMGTNAVSEDGQLINIDGMGNRCAALVFGPKSVIVICGINKLTRTVEDGYTRAHTVSAPLNIQRFPALKPPCSVTGICADCKSPDCICCDVVVTRFCKPAKRIKVIVVGESLGL